MTIPWDDFLAGMLSAGFTEEMARSRWDGLQPKAPVVALAPSPGQIINVVEYLAGIPDIADAWVIEGFVFDHGVSLVTGLPKAGKSTLVSEWLRCLETEGAGFLGRTVHLRPTLLVTEESGVPVRFKVSALTQLDIYDSRAAAGESFVSTLDKVRGWIADHAGGVIVIDTFAIWAGVDDENDASKITSAMKQINLLAATEECAVILVHHQRKGGGSFGEGVRGSGALVASVDLLIEVDRLESGAENERRLRVMGRVLNPGTIIVRFDTITRRYEQIEESAALLGEIENWLAPIPPDGPGLTRKEITEAWGTRGDRRITILLNKGRLREDGAGRTHRFWSVPPVDGAPVSYPMSAEGEE